MTPENFVIGVVIGGLLWTFFPDGPGGRNNGGQGNKPMGMDKRDQIELMRRMRGDD